tara:strand:- start:2633 stop:3625 length:993 start_codon:yes stop_codon:yes gene_type:complete
MIILVTGGTGFIGSHLCKKLLSMDHYVICLDNNFTGSMENISDILHHSNFEFIRHDIIDDIKLEIDQIYHLACPASPKHYQYNAIKTLKTNVLGSLNVLGLAKRTKATVLLTSTSEVYGDPNISPQTEEYRGNVSCIGIRSCYDEGKRAAESLFMDYHRSNNVDIRIARLFNTYGPKLHTDDGRVISNFIIQSLKNEPITIYGEGTQTRSFCYVDDTVNGLIALMNSDCTSPINIGNPNEKTIKEIAELIIKMTKSSSKLSYEQLPQDDPMQRKPCIKKAQKILNWNPTISLENGLRKTIDYFIQKLHFENGYNSNIRPPHWIHYSESHM